MHARAMRLPVFWLDLLLYVLVTLTVVLSVQTIGNILVLALLITPAAFLVVWLFAPRHGVLTRWVSARSRRRFLSTSASELRLS